MHIGWKCAFSLEESCHNVLGKSWFFFLVYCLGKITIFVLILVNFLPTGIFFSCFSSYAVFVQNQNSFRNTIRVSNSLDQISLDILSVLIWIQTVCKSKKQTTLGGKGLKVYMKCNLYKGTGFCFCCDTECDTKFQNIMN